MDYEQRARELGLEIPDYAVTPYSGVGHGTMKPHHQVGNLLFLGGHVPDLPDGSVLHPGRLGAELGIEQGYEAARLTALNCLAGIRLALGDLNGVAGIVRSLNFVCCVPGFTEINLVANGATDLFSDVFGDEVGIGGRATVGVVSLTRDYCFENWLTIEVRTG
jgi:hypothetical protein